MTPVTNKQPMPQAPGKGISSFPTPVIDDVLITEIVNAWKGNYTPLEYGAKWDDVSHASMQGSHPDHKLVYQEPASQDGEWIKRIWVNDRINQDSYNYAIKYSGGSQQHPIYIRTYILPREGYAPLPDLTPDEIYPTALLVEEEVQRNEGELDSKYIKVIRVFETLQGPEITSYKYNERGDLETISNQQVSPQTPPDPDGLLVTQSQVVKEDVSKGTKITGTVQKHSTLSSKEKKAGLLGETLTTDDIVDPTTSPDPLDEVTIYSSVEQISATKARKKTTKSSGPTSLQSNSLIDSPLGLVKGTINESIVDPSLQTNNSLYTLSDKIESIDATKSKRNLVQINQNWPQNSGVEYDEQLGVGMFYTETIVDPSIYINNPEEEEFSNVNYKPLDPFKSLQKKYDRERIGNTLLKQYFRFETQTQISLPDQLKYVTAYFGLAFGESSGEGQGEGNGESYNWNFNSSKTSSASVAGDLNFNVVKGFSGFIPALEHIFFLKINNDGTLDGSVLGTLNSFNSDIQYQQMPVFKTQTESVLLFSGSSSKTENDSQSQSVSLNGNASAVSENSSVSRNVSVNSVVLPSALHGDIEIQINAFGSNGDLPISYAVVPTRIEATDPPRFPVGNYLLSSNISLYKYGFVKVVATTIEIDERYV